MMTSEKRKNYKRSQMGNTAEHIDKTLLNATRKERKRVLEHSVKPYDEATYKAIGYEFIKWAMNSDSLNADAFFGGKGFSPSKVHYQWTKESDSFKELYEIGLTFIEERRRLSFQDHDKWLMKTFNRHNPLVREIEKEMREEKEESHGPVYYIPLPAGPNKEIEAYKEQKLLETKKEE